MHVEFMAVVLVRNDGHAYYPTTLLSWESGQDPRRAARA